ncbi:Proteasome subunit alpha type-4, partial [Perkinsus olseni]
AGVTMRPSEFVHSLLKSKELTAPSNVCRVPLISPLDIVRAPNPDSLKVMSEKFVAEHLGKESKGTETWKMEINSRNMSNMKRQMVLDLVSPYVDDSKHEVSIVGAELTLLVEVNQLLCGMSLCREFEALNKYHIGKCLGYGTDDEKDDDDGNDTKLGHIRNSCGVEYAMEAINNAGSTVGVLGKQCVILAGEKKTISKLLESGKASEKIYPIDDHVVCAVAGITSDANVLINQLRLSAQRYRYSYQEPIPVEKLVTSICDVKQQYTQFGGLRPFGVSFLFAGYDDHYGFQLYHTDPSGNLSGWKATAIGVNNQTAQGILKTDWHEDMSTKECLDLVAKVLVKSMDTATPTAETLEFGVLTLNKDKEVAFRMLADDEINTLMAAAKPEKPEAMRWSGAAVKHLRGVKQQHVQEMQDRLWGPMKGMPGERWFLKPLEGPKYAEWYFPSKYNVPEFKVGDYFEMQAERYRKKTHPAMAQFDKVMSRVYKDKDRIRAFLSRLDEESFRKEPAFEDLYAMYRLMDPKSPLSFQVPERIYRETPPMFGPGYVPTGSEEPGAERTEPDEGRLFEKSTDELMFLMSLLKDNLGNLDYEKVDRRIT